MSSAVIKPVEVGFAEFTSQLISETFEAVARALVKQEKEIMELEQITALKLEDFARLYITEDILRAEIIRLFPPKEGEETKSAIDEGEPYIPQTDKQVENPPIFILTGYRIEEKTDIKKAEDETFKITKTGYENIKKKVQSKLAAIYKDTLLLMVQKGVPRIMVDHGKVNTKLSFYLTTIKEKTKETDHKPSPSFISKLPLPKLMVKPVSNRSPEFLTLKVDVIGEVEITFKTIGV